MPTLLLEDLNMATASVAFTAVSPRPLGKTVLLYFKEARYEFLKYLRLPIYSLSTVMFPIMFYVLFGLVMNRQGAVNGTSVSTYLLATYGTFGVIGASLFANGAGVAAERGLGWMQVKRASPMPPFANFLAKFIVGMIFSSIIEIALVGLGILFGGVHIELATAAKLVGTLVLGAVPFCSLGLAIGFFAGPNSAPAIVNMIYLPLSFLSGLWVPVNMLPKFLQHIATGLPPYHLAQLALNIIGIPTGGRSFWFHWEFLIGFMLICLGIARIGFQRDEKMYG
jgi:ABC-2 type transport system permease protein